MATLTLQPSAGVDTYISAANPTFNYGTSTLLETISGASARKALVLFSLASLPSNAIIKTAVLSLVCTSSGGGGLDVAIHRAITAFFEGSQNGAAPSGGQDGSTWNLRNANGAVAWSGGAGGAGASDYQNTATDTVNTTVTGTYNWNVATDVAAFVAGTTNNGWWFVQNGSLLRQWASSDNATALNRPKLVVTYSSGIAGVVAGTSTTTGVLSSNHSSGLSTEAVIQPDPTAGKDTVIRQSNVGTNYGITTEVSIGYDAGSNLNKFLIQMPLTDIPVNAIIYGAFLGLYVANQGAAASTDFTLRRALTDWYEGVKNGATPGAGENSSTWNLRNTNGSVAWGAVGGLSGTDYELVGSASDTATVYDIGSYFYFEVTQDIIDFVLGTKTNRGWWVIPAAALANNYKNVATSDSVTTNQRPKLLVYYTVPQGTAVGASSVTGVLKGKTTLEASSAGSSTAIAQLITNFFSIGHTDGTSTVSGTLVAEGRLSGSAFGDSTSLGDIKASYHSVGTADGTSFHVAHLKGKFYLEGLAAGTGLLVAVPSFEGQLRGSAEGSATATADGYARARSVARQIGCNPVPLFYATDGSVRDNGQLNILNFLGERSGYYLKNYRPQIAQYKEGGSFSSSPQSQGRRLRARFFDNVIDVLEVATVAYDQDALIDFQQDLLAFQEAAADYWISQTETLPYYLVARAAYETNTRYAIIHMMSCPELENPYTQPFFDTEQAAFNALTIRIEHGPWYSTPPGRFDCVSISSRREWTVSGWQAGS
jgi:hypothetical protein